MMDSRGNMRRKYENKIDKYINKRSKKTSPWLLLFLVTGCIVSFIFGKDNLAAGLILIMSLYALFIIEMD